jgi:putative DNA primase/helicase
LNATPSGDFAPHHATEHSAIEAAKQVIHSVADYGREAAPDLSPEEMPMPDLAELFTAVLAAADMGAGGVHEIGAAFATTYPQEKSDRLRSLLMDCAEGISIRPGRRILCHAIESIKEHHKTRRRWWLSHELARATSRNELANHIIEELARLNDGEESPNRSADVVFPTTFPDLTRFGESDADNAERVNAIFGGNFHHVADSGQWLIWNGCRWTPDRDGAMTRIFLKTMEETARQALKIDNLRAGESLARHAMRSRDAAKVTAGLTMLKAVRGVTIAAGDLDSNPWMLGTPNGLIDLLTGKPIKPEKRELVTKSIACDFDANAKCPIWESVIETAAGGDSELIRFFQVWTGYTLTGCVSEECLAFLHGTGANGKGTFTECVRALLGDYAITAPESLFVADRNTSATNDIARLAGCRMACAAELDENAAFAESRLKAITSRDAITARFLHREFFDFTPTHKFWISGNHKPTVRGVDHGIWRRIRLIPFTFTIPPEKRDRNLADKLRNELPGILNWAIQGCMIWQAEGLQTPQCVAKATAEYQKAEDVVGQFLDESTNCDESGRVLRSSLYEAYQGWAGKQGIARPLTATKFNRKMEERGFQKAKITGGWYWKGLSLDG